MLASHSLFITAAAGGIINPEKLLDVLTAGGIPRLELTDGIFWFIFRGILR